ncbi:MAG: hypothetical protein H6541_03380 [Lentimicrobiaceae bacterium]|nr:hypothetical protein [Lentimicrobiaceae bacterium]MCO5266525.1 hypothetical protein [Lentimicrobium sp.]HPG33568.1 hypothetical protein [Lentimicrobium sp.]
MATSVDNPSGNPIQKKKKRGCCFGCLIIVLIVMALILGVIGYFWYQSFPKKSAVEKEYHNIPEYFEN